MSYKTFKPKLLLLVIMLCAKSIFAQPVINNFSPASGSINTNVIITGNGFSSTPANNIVYFGAVKAQVTNASSGSLTVKAPVGASFQPISVTVNNLTAYSAKPFILTFNGNKEGLSMNSFTRIFDSSTAEQPSWITTSDINGDGKPDIIVANSGAGTISIFKNTGSANNIAFATKQNFAVSSSPFWITAADVDGDGKPDIITANASAATISVLRNTSSASVISFQSKLDFITDAAPFSMAVGDFNGDGKPDIATANSTANTISVFKNTSSIGVVSFENKISYASGISPVAIVAGDIDGDGKTDLAVANNGASTISVFKNTSASGNIQFASKVDSVSGTSPSGIAIADIDADGKQDLLTSNANVATISVFKNVSTPGTIKFNAKADFSTGINPQSISVNDMNGDGKTDVVVLNGNSATISILKNISSGTIAFSDKADYACGNFPISASLNDISGDGKNDIITANYNSNTISVLKNTIFPLTIASFTPAAAPTGDTVTIKGTDFSFVNIITFGGVKAQSFIVQSDSVIKAVVGNGASGFIQVETAFDTALIAGFIYLPPPTIVSFSPANAAIGSSVTIAGKNFTGITSVRLGDTSAASFIVKSTDTIIAVVDAVAGGNVSVTNAYGTGLLEGFYNGVIVNSLSPASGSAGTDITISGNNFSTINMENIVYFGAAKAQVTSSTKNTLQVKIPFGASYQFNTVNVNQSMVFSKLPFMVTFTGGNNPIDKNSFANTDTLNVNGYAQDVCAGDFDNDGKVDVAVAVSGGSGNMISVFKNISAIANIIFAAKKDFIEYESPFKIITADLNRDGKLDLVASTDNGKILIFTNTTSADKISFSTTKLTAVNAGRSIAVNDLDKDGKPDLVLNNIEDTTTDIYRNTTNGNIITFSAPVTFKTGPIPTSVSIADLDGDNKPDIAVTSETEKMISVFKNISKSGLINFTARLKFSTGYYSEGVVAGDLNLDGKPELAVVNFGDNTISVLKNTSINGIISFAAKKDFKLTGLSSVNIALNDMNGDGKTDIVVSNNLQNDYVPDSVSVLQNNSSADNILFISPVSYVSGNSVAGLSINDFDNDGKPDMAATNNINLNVAIYRNKQSGVLAENLLSFNGALKNDQTVLSWQVAGTEKIEYFIVEYSINSVDFSDIGIIKGNNNNANNYSFIHTHLQSEKNYYRLKIIDADGEVSFSNVITITFNVSQLKLLLQPNPANDFVIIRIPKSAKDSWISIVDMNGRKIKTITVKQSDQQLKLSLKNISAGMYKVIWTDNNITLNEALIVQ
jgi:hypothetical protein